MACIIPVIQGTFHNGVGGPRWDGGLRSGYVGGCFIIAIMGLAVILPSPERRGDVVRWLGAITPLGGTALLIAWVLFVVAVWRMN